MSQYVTGNTIKELREQRGMRQADLAQKLAVSDKAVSKWETGKGYPDISLLEPLAQALGASVTELISGNTIKNTNISANMTRCKLYACPVCGNVITSIGEAAISCHGISLAPLEAEDPDAGHKVHVSRVEDEYYVQVDHPMSKQHHLSFIAALGMDRLQLIKLYPESDAAGRVRIAGTREIYFYCNRDGLFKVRP